MYNICSVWTITLITIHIMITHWSSQWFGCDALFTRKGYAGRGSSIRESMIFSRKEPDPKCASCAQCNTLNEIMQKGRCRPRPKPTKPPRPPPPPPTTPPPTLPTTTRRTTTTTAKPDPGRCQAHGKSGCRCQRDVCCAADPVTKTCTDIENYCQDLTFAEDECRKPQKYYAFGGVLCANYLRGGPCDDAQTFMAVNVNGDKTTGSDGITYEKGSTLKIIDPEDTRNYESLTDSHEDLLGLSHAGDRCLYTSYIYSKDKDNCNCLSTPIQKLRDGRYEIILKFVDPTVNGRIFDVKLNGVEVLNEFRILRYTSVNYSPLEVIIPFEVRNNHTTLLLKGHSQTKIKKSKILLSFCRGQCSGHKAYIISAIAVRQYPNVIGAPPPPPSITPPPPPPPELTEEEKCKLARDDIRKCKMYPFCRYGNSDHCQHQDTFCSADKLTQIGHCLKPGMWVSVDGDLCHVTRRLLAIRKREDCTVTGNATAINFGDGTVTGSDGLTYVGLPHDISDPDNILSTNEPSRLPVISGVPQEDQNIYNTFVGGSKPNLHGKCAQFRLELEQDGNYLLRLKFAEHIFMEPGKRRFTIRLNGKDILKEFDILSIAHFGEGKDVLLNFEVSHNIKKLTATGYPESWGISDKVLIVDVCNGIGIAEDNSPILTGVSLVRLTLPCSAYGTRGECRCLGANTAETGRRCAYDHDHGACEDLEQFCIKAFKVLNGSNHLDGLFCPLINSHYLFNGHICSTEFMHPNLARQTCNPGYGTGFGVGLDFNGPEFTYNTIADLRYEFKAGGIRDIEREYSDDDNLADFLIPGTTKNYLMEAWSTYGTLHSMSNWFASKGDPGKCLSIRLDKLYQGRLLEGEYFLVAFIPDDHFGLEKGQERMFDIRINDVIVASNLNPTELASEIRSKVTPIHFPDSSELGGDARTKTRRDEDEYDVLIEDKERKVGGLQIVTYVLHQLAHIQIFNGTHTIPIKPLFGNAYNFQICNAINACGGRSHHFIAAGIYIFPARYTNIARSGAFDAPEYFE